MLRAELARRGQPPDGLKAQLVARLVRGHVAMTPSISSGKRKAQAPPALAAAAAAGSPALPYGGDMAAAMQASDRAAIRTLMQHRSTAAASSSSSSSSTSSSAAAAGQATCPICSEERADVEPLAHASLEPNRGDVAGHQACGSCRAAMVSTNSACPWCRREVVWAHLYGFLDGFKRCIGGASAGGAAAGAGEQDHQGLANLLTHWQEFEMTRSPSDLSSFARDLCTDSSLASHVARGIAARSPWLRDSVRARSIFFLVSVYVLFVLVL
jgi:RNA polymerase subunit RPABC4/transcription elongation factor Spt4